MEELSIVDSIAGILAVDKGNRVIDKAVFPKDPVKIAEKIARIEAGSLVEEAEQLIQRLRKHCKRFIFESEAVAANARKTLKVKVKVSKPSEAGEYVRSNLGDIAAAIGFVEKPGDVFSVMREVSTILTKLRVKAAASKRDQIVIQMINSIDELDKIMNLLAGRMREWYGLHFPEMSRLIDSHDTYAKLVTELGLRENFNLEALERLGIAGEKARRLVEVAGSSLGGMLNEGDMAALQSLSHLYMEASRLRCHFVDRMETLMEEVSPNLKAVTGATLGARLIALAGGLERLSRFPASTVQVLGAEKALFRSLKTGTRPPKHGIIFQHHLIHKAPRWQRGKISRVLAAKAAIAARIDAFTGSYIGEKLKADLEKRISEIGEKYKTPPKRPQRFKGSGRGKGGKS
ncbi:MAG: C/D box methylation guide ribonucleoprotein complex aNOP56 subunit [Candidatus Bathyarchaeia archaeon]